VWRASSDSAQHALGEPPRDLAGQLLHQVAALRRGAPAPFLGDQPAPHRQLLVLDRAGDHQLDVSADQARAAEPVERAHGFA
jgi:hypothetical protein